MSKSPGDFSKFLKVSEPLIFSVNMFTGFSSLQCSYNRSNTSCHAKSIVDRFYFTGLRDFYGIFTGFLRDFYGIFTGFYGILRDFYGIFDGIKIL